MAPRKRVPPGAAGDPASAPYGPNGVCWIANATERTADARPHPYTLLAVRRRIFLELRIPARRNGIESPAPALAAAITRADPLDPAQRFVCT